MNRGRPFVWVLVGWLCSGAAWGAPGPAPHPIRRIFIDAGHGSAGNSGNTGAECQREEDFTLQAAQALASALISTRRFEVKLSRAPGKKVDYRRRIRAAEKWRADLVVSLHSDARSDGSTLTVTERSCLQATDSPGFSVLWSDEGAPALVSRREAIADALSLAMRENGFRHMAGEYVGQYDRSETPGVYVDRTGTGRRIYFLWKPSMPSVIVETHNAFDPTEAAQWRQPETLERFSAAVIRAIDTVNERRSPAAVSRR